MGHLGLLQLQSDDGDEPVDRGMADMELVDEELFDREHVGKELETDFCGKDCISFSFSFLLKTSKGLFHTNA